MAWWLVVQESGTPGLSVLAAAAAGGGVAAVAGVLLALGWRVPPPVPVAAAALPLSIAVLHGVWARDVGQILAVARPDQMALLVARQIAETIDTRIVLGVVLLPLAVALVGCAAAGVVRGPRSPWGMGLATVAVLGEVALGLALFREGLPGPAILTAVVAAGLGAPVIAAGAAGDPHKGGPEAAITAGYLYAVAMGAWWAALHATNLAAIMTAMASAGDDRSLLLGQALHELWLDRWLGVGAVLLAALPVLGGLIAGRAELGRRLAWVALGVPLWGVPLALVLDDPAAAQLRALLTAGF